MRRFFIKVQNAIALREQHEDTGATMVEYGLMVALVAVVAVVAVRPLGTAVAGIFTSITASL
jgi:pilus assembly protein Flp/PilA